MCSIEPQMFLQLGGPRFQDSNGFTQLTSFYKLQPATGFSRQPFKDGCLPPSRVSSRSTQPFRRDRYTSRYRAPRPQVFSTSRQVIRHHGSQACPILLAFLGLRSSKYNLKAITIVFPPDSFFTVSPHSWLSSIIQRLLPATTAKTEFSLPLWIFAPSLFRLDSTLELAQSWRFEPALKRIISIRDFTPGLRFQLSRPFPLQGISLTRSFVIPFLGFYRLRVYHLYRCFFCCQKKLPSWGLHLSIWTLFLSGHFAWVIDSPMFFTPVTRNKKDTY